MKNQPIFKIESLGELRHSELKSWSQNALDKSVPNWIIKIHGFLREWFSDNTHIKLQTSGTVAEKTSFLRAKKYLRFSAEESLSVLKIPSITKTLLCLPANYIAAQLMIIRALVGNLCLHCIAPDAKPLKKCKNGFGFAALVPYQLHHSLANIKYIRCLLIGGGFLSHSLKRKIQTLETKLPKTDIYETFGMAETLTHIALRKITGKLAVENFFLPLPSVQIMQNDRGCLMVKSPQRGLKNYFQTKDIVKIHENGSFDWLGREDFIIETGSMKICPEMLEKKIYSHLPFLRGFFIGSLPHLRFTSELIMLIEGKPNKELLQKIKKKLSAELEFQEMPKKFFFVEFFSRTLQMKIQRKKTLENLTQKN